MSTLISPVAPGYSPAVQAPRRQHESKGQEVSLRTVRDQGTWDTFVVTQEGVKPDPEDVAAINQ